MKIPFTTPILVAALALSSTIAFTTQAQAAPLTTTVRCLYNNGLWRTFAQRGATTVVLIDWKTKIAGYTPQQRCEQVSSTLNQLSQTHGGQLQGIRLKTGEVKGSPVICYVDNTTSTFCNPSNHVMNLPKNSNPELELRRLFARVDAPYASGTPLQNSAPEYEVDFGNAVEKMLDAAENQEGGSSPNVTPLENQGEGNRSGEGGL